MSSKNYGILRSREPAGHLAAGRTYRKRGICPSSIIIAFIFFFFSSTMGMPCPVVICYRYALSSLVSSIAMASLSCLTFAASVLSLTTI